jgi:hypothetical protein
MQAGIAARATHGEEATMHSISVLLLKRSGLALALALALVLVTGCGNDSVQRGPENDAGVREPSASGEARPSTAAATSTRSRDPSDTPAQPATPVATEKPVTPTPVRKSTPREPITVPGCENVGAEAHHCVTMSDNEVLLLGLDSGRFCHVTTTAAPITAVPLVSGSIAWLGEELYVCSEGGLIRISLRDGSWAAGGRACNAVATYDGGLLVNRWLIGSGESVDGPWSESPLAWYPDFDAYRHGEPERTFDLGSFSATMTVQGERLYTAWHAGISVDVSDLNEQRAVGALTLEDYNGWMLGMAVTEDGYLVLSGDPWGQTVYVFDAYDGRRVKRFDIDRVISGLACSAAGSSTPRDTATPTATWTPDEPTPTPCRSESGCPDPCADLGADPRPFRPHQLPPSVPIEMHCLSGSGSSNYALADDLLVPGATEELHVIGVYEGRGNPGLRPYSQGVVDVTVHQRPKPVVLALTSYANMLWRIALDPGARLSQVIVQGYGPQQVEGLPAGVAVEHRAPHETCGYAYGWEVAHNGGGGGHAAMMASLRRLTGLIETSFQGCYGGNHFEIPYWSGDPPIWTPTPVPGDESIPRDSVVFPECEAVTAERQYCLTTTYAGVALLGLDSGRVCPLAGTSAGGVDTSAHSIAWRGELMYACTDAGLLRISLRDGSREAAQVPCATVAAYAGGLLLSGSLTDPNRWLTPLQAYPDYAAVLNGEVGRSFSVGGGASRFAVDGETFYGAWHSTGTIDVADLTADEPLASLTLDGYDGWILGMSITDGQLVVSGDIWGDTVRIYDAQTGDHLRDIHPEMPVQALSCVSSESPS